MQSVLMISRTGALLFTNVSSIALGWTALHHRLHKESGTLAVT